MEQPPSNRDQCGAQRRDGERCQAPALPGRPWCFAHAPELAEKRAEGCRKGGRGRAALVRLQGLCPPRLVALFDTLERAIAEVHDGTIEPGQAQAMAALARAAVTVLQAGEVEQRLRELEGRAS